MKTKTIYAVWSEWSDGYEGYYETYDLAYEGAREFYEELELEEDNSFEVFIAESGLMGINRVPLFVKDTADAA